MPGMPVPIGHGVRAASRDFALVVVSNLARHDRWRAERGWGARFPRRRFGRGHVTTASPE
jgi:hypothetical protein